VCRNKDANTGWTTASDGTLEERVYYCQNWRADVSAIVSSGGAMKEWDKYSAYGIPFGLPAGDTDSDGDCDSTDVSQVQSWITGVHYDVRGDLDLDGDVDLTDKSLASGMSGTTLGRGNLSSATKVANRKGYAGYECDAAIGLKYHVRHRVLAADLGRWLTRDPIGYVDGANLYELVSSNPTTTRDPLGLSPDDPVAIRATPISSDEGGSPCNCEKCKKCDSGSCGMNPSTNNPDIRNALVEAGHDIHHVGGTPTGPEYPLEQAWSRVNAGAMGKAWSAIEGLMDTFHPCVKVCWETCEDVSAWWHFWGKTMGCVKNSAWVNSGGLGAGHSKAGDGAAVASACKGK